MLTAKINLTVTIENCPANGLAAVEYRLAAGLPAAPSSEVAIAIEREDGDLCRRHPELCNTEANLVIRYDGRNARGCDNGAPSEPAWRLSAASLALGAYGSQDRHTVPAAAIVAALAGDVEPLIAALEVSASAADARAVAHTEARAEAERRANEARAERERPERERQTARDATLAAERTDALEWIAEHGSARLRRAVEEGLYDASEAVYRDERLMTERPGWRWDARLPGSAIDPRNPTTRAFALLDDARKSDPSAQLVTWRTESEEYAAFERGESDAEEAPAEYDYQPGATATFLGRTIVYLG